MIDLIVEFWQNNKFLNRSFFDGKLKKIDNLTLRNYIIESFKFKYIFTKLILILISGILIFSLGFGLREYFINYRSDEVVINYGVAFSLADSQNPAFVYTIQSIPVIFSFIGIVVFKNPLNYLGMTWMFFGGLMNIIDRSIATPATVNGHSTINGVIDYFHAPGSVFNIADVFIVSGVIIAIVLIVTNLIIAFLKERKQDIEDEKDFFKIHK